MTEEQVERETLRGLTFAPCPSLYLSPQIRDFVDRFMPAYERYLPALLSTGPQRPSGTGDGSVKPAPVMKVGIALLSSPSPLLPLSLHRSKWGQSEKS
jgi:hypothetical protein